MPSRVKDDTIYNEAEIEAIMNDMNDSSDDGGSFDGANASEEELDGDHDYPEDDDVGEIEDDEVAERRAAANGDADLDALDRADDVEEIRDEDEDSGDPRDEMSRDASDIHAAAAAADDENGGTVYIRCVGDDKVTAHKDVYVIHKGVAVDRLMPTTLCVKDIAILELPSHSGDVRHPAYPRSRVPPRTPRTHDTPCTRVPRIPRAPAYSRRPLSRPTRCLCTRWPPSTTTPASGSSTTSSRRTRSGR